MPSTLDRLPPEILQTVLAYLPIQSLLAFACTNKLSYQSATYALNTLELAVFPKQVYATLAFLDARCRSDIDQNDETQLPDDPFTLRSERPRSSSPVWKHSRRRKELHEVGIISQPVHSSVAKPSPRSRSRTSNRTTSARSVSRPAPRLVSRPWSASSHSPLELRTREITIQNDIAEEVLSSPSLCYLKSLTLHLYDLFTPSLASTLASALPGLQHLCLNFSHPYIHDTTLPPRYWRDTPSVGCGSPVWNSLAGIGDGTLSSLRLRNLKSLTLKRSSITSFQLRSWIEKNPSLRHLHLEKVRGVDQEFCQWLGEQVTRQRIEGGGGLERIALTDCGELICKTRIDFDWIGRIAGKPPSEGYISPEASSRNSAGDGEHRQVKQNKPHSMIGAELQYLSLRSCAAVNEELFLRLAHGDYEDDGNDSSSNSSNNSKERDSIPGSSPSATSTQDSDGWQDNIGVLVSPQNVRIQRKRTSQQDEDRSRVIRSTKRCAATSTTSRRHTMNLVRSGSQSPPLRGLESKGTRAEQADNLDDICIEVDPDAM